MYIIKKEFHFSASHILHGLPDGHPCGRLHGHNYVVVVTLRSKELNNVGFVQDYGELAPIKDWIDKNWDHTHLNDFSAFEKAKVKGFEKDNPSAENIACFLYGLFKRMFPLLSSIEVKETDKTTAIYFEDGK